MATLVHEAPAPQASTNQQSQTLTPWQRVLRFFICTEDKRHSDSDHRRSSSMHMEYNHDGFCYDVPDEYDNLNEIAAPAPVQNRDEGAGFYAHRTLENGIHGGS